MNKHKKNKKFFSKNMSLTAKSKSILYNIPALREPTTVNFIKVQTKQAAQPISATQGLSESTPPILAAPINPAQIQVITPKESLLNPNSATDAIKSITIPFLERSSLPNMQKVIKQQLDQIVQLVQKNPHSDIKDAARNKLNEISEKVSSCELTEGDYLMHIISGLFLFPLSLIWHGVSFYRATCINKLQRALEQSRNQIEFAK